jgi:hypothetical protein
LNRDLALEYLLARKLVDGTGGLAWSREVDEGISDRAIRARILWDGSGLAANMQSQ